MKVLGLLRHAKSDWDDMAVRDFDRKVNARGRQGAALMGSHIANHGIKWGKVLASSAQRVRDTLQVALPDTEPHYDDRLYLAGPDTICEVLREYGEDADSILIAAHNPGLHDMLFTLIGEGHENALFDVAAEKFPTCAFAVIELQTDSWADLTKANGELVHFARPRDLDPDLGPEE